MNTETLSYIHNFCREHDLTIVHEDGYVDIVIGPALFTIQTRPHYCDRGRFIVQCFSQDPSLFYIDDADLFPHYYFKMENMLSELLEFIKVRGLNKNEKAKINS